MPEKRFTETEFLPTEMVDRLDRKVASGYVAVQDDAQQVVTITLRITIKANKIGDADGEYTLEQKHVDQVASETGKIRDGQLVLPGTGLRSDDPPLSWKDAMLAAPAGRK